MKKVIFTLLFLIINIFSYANYLISNSEIVLFYDRNYNQIEYIRGDIFNNFEISRVEPKIIINGKVIELRKYVESIKVVDKTNILKITYDIKGNKIEMSIIPSMLDKSQLIFVANLAQYKTKASIDFVFQIVPQHDNKFTRYNPKEKTYSYDKFIFTSNSKGTLFIARNSKLDEFILEEVVEPIKKYEEDNLYYIIRDVNNSKSLIFNIDFYVKDKLSSKVPYNIEEKELNYWENLSFEPRFLEKSKIELGQLKNLEIISTRSLIPNEISFNKSKEDLNNKIKLLYINSVVDKNFDINRFFEDMNIKKKDSEAVVYYTMLFRYLNESHNHLDRELFEKKVSLEVLSLLDYLEEDNGAIVNVRDNIRNYAWYFRLIKNIKDRVEFASEREFILEKEELLREYVMKNYLLEDGLKSQKEDIRSNYKNIGDIDFLPEAQQKAILKRDYEEYYNSEYGLLTVPKSKSIDLKYNLNFIITLYKNKEYELADRLFANVEKLIEKNNQFLLPRINIEKNNPVGIYGEMLYLYFRALQLSQKR